MTGSYVVVMIDHEGQPTMCRTRPSEDLHDDKPVMYVECWRCGGSLSEGELGHDPRASVFGWVLVCTNCVTAGDLEAQSRGAA